MCVASPGTVVEINGNIAKVDYNGNTVTANAGLADIKVGDRVLVHAGLIIQKMGAEEADEMEALFRELEEMGDA